MSEEAEKATQASAVLTQKMLDARTILIYGEINQELAEKVTQQLLLLENSNHKDITIFINSQGGHVEAADTIHDIIRFIEPTVRVIGTGWVASAGIPIYLAAEAENRYSLPNTRYMIHQPLGGVQGQSSEIEIEAKEIIRMRERLNRLIADRTGQSYEKIVKDSDRNFWLNAEEAKTYGIVSTIIQTRNDIEA